MEISLTELRQRLFELADRVIETGEAIIITRRGARLRITRDEPMAKAATRLARLRQQELEIGPLLEPHESPAEWVELPAAVAQPSGPYAVDTHQVQSPVQTGNRRKRRKP